MVNESREDGHHRSNSNARKVKIRSTPLPYVLTPHLLNNPSVEIIWNSNVFYGNKHALIDMFRVIILKQHDYKIIKEKVLLIMKSLLLYMRIQ